MSVVWYEEIHMDCSDHLRISHYMCTDVVCNIVVFNANLQVTLLGRFLPMSVWFIHVPNCHATQCIIVELYY